MISRGEQPSDDLRDRLKLTETDVSADLECVARERELVADAEKLRLAAERYSPTIAKAQETIAKLRADVAKLQQRDDCDERIDAKLEIIATVERRKQRLIVLSTTAHSVHRAALGTLSLFRHDHPRVFLAGDEWLDHGQNPASVRGDRGSLQVTYK